MEHHKHVVTVGEPIEISFKGENIRLMVVQFMHKVSLLIFFERFVKICNLSSVLSFQFKDHVYYYFLCFIICIFLLYI